MLHTAAEGGTANSDRWTTHLCGCTSPFIHVSQLAARFTHTGGRRRHCELQQVVGRCRARLAHRDLACSRARSEPLHDVLHLGHARQPLQHLDRGVLPHLRAHARPTCTPHMHAPHARPAPWEAPGKTLGSPWVAPWQEGGALPPGSQAGGHSSARARSERSGARPAVSGQAGRRGA